MCEPASVMAAAALFSAGTAAYSATRNPPKPPKPPKPAAAPVTPPKPKPPVGGYGSTLLTGPRGLLSGSQNIGTNTLLGK